MSDGLTDPTARIAAAIEAATKPQATPPSERPKKPRGKGKSGDPAAAAGDGPQTVPTPATGQNSRSRDRSKTESGAAERGPTRADADAALDAVAAGCALFRAPDGAAYATFAVGDHRETHPVRSRRFRNHLSGEVYRLTKRTIGAQKVEDALRVMEDRAARDAPMREPWLRVGAFDGRLYLALWDDACRVVEVRENGWAVIANPGLPFVRKSGVLALPEPEDGYELSELRPFVNSESEADFLLVVGWLVAALHPRGPYPVAAIGGRQGSGKSVLTRYMRQLVDPNVALIRSPPKDERDLVIAAKNAHVLAYDNLSRCEQWLSDGFCRIGNGAGFSTRLLHSDDEEMLFSGSRPIAINSIPEVAASAPDLAERTLAITLRPIRKDERRPEREIDAAWEAARPRILGTLLTGMTAGLRNRGRCELTELPRMADFVKLVTECESGLGIEAGAFAAAFHDKSEELADAAFEANPVAVALRNFIRDVYRGHWEGTPTELLARLNENASEMTRRARSWPGTPQALGSAIRRHAPSLEKRGILVGTGKRQGERCITLTPSG